MHVHMYRPVMYSGLKVLDIYIHMHTYMYYILTHTHTHTHTHYVYSNPLLSLPCIQQYSPNARSHATTANPETCQAARSSAASSAGDSVKAGEFDYMCLYVCD